MDSSKKACAFYDLDGTLVSTNLVHTYLFFSRNQPSVARTLLKTAGGIARIPAFAVVDRVNRVKFNEMLFKLYEGEFEDRLLELAEEHFEEVYKPNIFPGVYELVQASQRRGLHQVIVSGSLDFVVRPLARHLGIDDIVTNRLEFKCGVATGKLVPPILAGANKARFMQDYARTHGVDLVESYAYSDSYSDYPMLAVVGRPAVVNPDKKLLAEARVFNWPVLDLR